MSKKEQIRLLKGAQLTETKLFSLFNFAEECGYKFSHYKWQGDPKSVKEEKLPSFMHLKDDGSVEYVGDTTLTEGQMRTIINQADVLIARINWRFHKHKNKHKRKHKQKQRMNDGNYQLYSKYRKYKFSHLLCEIKVASCYFQTAHKFIFWGKVSGT